MGDNPEINDLLIQAWSYRREGDYPSCRKLLEQAHKRCGPTDHSLLGRVFHIRRQIEADHDQMAQALEYSLQSVAHYQKSGDKDRISHSTRHLADLQRQMGKVADAIKSYETAIAGYRSNPATSALDIANASRGYALALESAGETKSALSIWREVSVAYADLGLKQGVEEASKHMERLGG